MRIKKSNISSVGTAKTTSFFLGLILALSFLYVGLEYTSMADCGNDYTDDMFDDITQDLNLTQKEDKKNIISVAPSPPKPAVTENIKVVNLKQDEPDRLSPNTDNAKDDSRAASTEADNTLTPLEQTQIITDKPVDFKILEQIPEFPGGMGEFTKWLTHNLHYPSVAQRQKIEGKVVVSFIVEKDGGITDRKVEKSVHPLLDKEAMRVLGLMPKWKPGMENDKPCRTLFAIPIVFQL